MTKYIDINEPVKNSLTVFIHILHTFSPHTHTSKKINEPDEWELQMIYEYR